MDAEHERNSTAKAYQLVLPERPSQEQLTMFFNNHKAKVRGRIVLVGKPATIPVNLNPPAKRTQRRTGTSSVMDQTHVPLLFPDAVPNANAGAPNAPRPLD